MREVTIVCRAGSRHGLEYYARLQEQLPKRGVAITEAHMVKSRSDLQKRIRQAAKAGKNVIAVVGGDGSQSAAVAELVHTDSVLAVVPAGTGNSFALSLGIKADIEHAIETIVNGKDIAIDVGVVNGIYFANTATIGLIAQAAKITPTPLKKIVGPVAYGLAAIVPMLRDNPFELHVKWPGSDLKVETYQAIVVASGRYYGWQPLTPQSGLDSGNLSFFSAEGKTPADVIAMNAALLRGEQLKLENAHYFSAPKLTIKTKPKQPLNIDGHPLGKTPAKFKVAHKALRVLVP